MPTTDTRPSDRAADQIAGECYAVRIRLLNRTITALYDDALRPLGMTVGQLNILVVLARNGAISPGHVARRLNMEKSTISRNIERMRRNGWVSVAAAEKGHRQELALTRRGEILLERSLPAWTEAQTRARAVLGRGGADAIHSVGNAVWTHVGHG